MCGACVRVQAANAAASAEGNAMGSANHARIEQSMASLAAAMTAMALFGQVRALLCHRPAVWLRCLPDQCPAHCHKACMWGKHQPWCWSA